MRNKILVTGGMGFIGQHIVVELLRRNRSVLIIDNLTRASINDPSVFKSVVNNVSIDLLFFQIDIRDKTSLTDLFSKYGTKIEAIIHLAALKSVPESIENPNLYKDVNVKGTKYLLELTHSYKIPKFVFSSSACVYGGFCPKNGYSESDELLIDQIAHPYGRFKREAEMLMQEFAQKKELKQFFFFSLR